MSYQTWHTYGYGIRVDDVKTTPIRLLNLASIKPELFEKVENYLKMLGEYKVEELSLEDFDEFDDVICGKSGIGAILFYAIDEFQADYVEDFEGNAYVLFPEKYPWIMSDREKSLTKDDVKNIFEKYIKILSDEPVEITYWSVENGG